MNILPKKAKKSRMYKKMLHSLENKMVGNNKIWWSSLTNDAQYHFLFSWLNHKKYLSFGKKPKFKHFLKAKKQKYIPKKDNLRDAMISHLID